MRKAFVTALVLFFISFSVFANGISELPQSDSYVASTSWVAVIAQLAGIDNVKTIAPANLKHPPEYEITANDMYTVAKAKLFMHAGYEVMMKSIASASQIDKNKVLKVKTTNTLDNLSAMVKMLSEKAGTVELAEKRFAKYRTLIEDSRNRISNSTLKTVDFYVNVNQAELARDLGLNIAGTFGPGPLTSDQIALCADKKFKIIIDNYHNPVSDPILSVSPDTKIIFWKNFPDKINEDALYKLIKEDIDLLF